jgi:hypothetical protein
LSDIAEYCDVPLGALASYNPQMPNLEYVPPGQIVQIPPVRGDIYSERTPPPLIDYSEAPAVYAQTSATLLDRGTERQPSPFEFLKLQRPAQTARPIASGESAIVGILTNEGLKWPTLRDDRGHLFTLLGDLDGHREGDRVLVRGYMAANDRICRQVEAVQIAEIERAPW